MKELQEATQSAIEQSKQTAAATVSDMLETHGMLRADSTTLFERLREANILLQEVFSGAHDNMSALEHTMVTRVSEFVSTMNDLMERSGAASDKIDEHITQFRGVTNKVLTDLTQLAARVRGARTRARRGGRPGRNAAIGAPTTMSSSGAMRWTRWSPGWICGPTISSSG